MDEWIEELPDRCPPDEAFDPSGRVFYRLSKKNTPQESDFQSHRSRWPDKEFEQGECIVRSLSIWDDRDRCLSALRLPRQKKNSFVMTLNLKSSDGLVAKTGGKGHYSWWRTRSYDVGSTQTTQV